MASSDKRFEDVYRNSELEKRLDTLSDRFHFVDESSRFARLVNISESSRHPYHRWARYREGYSGELVKELILRSDVDLGRQYVIDPMCGSGSTLVAAKELGYKSIGFDVNPFAVDLASAKVDHYETADLDMVGQLLKNHVTAKDDSTRGTSPGMDTFRGYFDEENFRELASIRFWTESIRDSRAKALLKIAWLSILEDCSNRRKDGNGLSTVKSRVNDVLDFFRGRVMAMCEDVRNHPLPDVVSRASTGSVLEVSGQIDEFSSEVHGDPGAVIFSPPYANSFDYFETYKMELMMGGYCDLDGLVELRQKAIRNYRKGYGRELVSNNDLVEMICREIWSAIPEKERLTRVRDGRTRLVPNLLRAYFEDMNRSIHAISHMIRSGGWCHIVVDQSAYVGVIVPTDILLAQIAERQGFEVNAIIRCKKANTSGQQLAQYPYLKTMLRGSIVSIIRNESDPAS